MEPNFRSGNYLLIDEMVYHFRSPERGEVIVFKYPGDNRSYFIKRLIGLPGETVKFEDNKVAIYKDGNRKVLEESYVSKGQEDIIYSNVKLAADQYFVMGDNRGFSFDSRSWGPLNQTNIIGLARFRLWPINEVMAFSPPIYQ